MLLFITERCQMNCTHCMDSCTSTSKHMSYHTFKAVFQFLQRFPLNMLVLSGGEPTEHPLLFKILDKLKTLKDTEFFITSNGDFLKDINYTKKLFSYNIPVQITNISKFYPRHIPNPNLPNVLYFDKLRTIDKVGRALTNWDSFDDDIKKIERSLCPSCFNLRSFIYHSGMSLIQANFILSIKAKNCTPAITINGDIVCGEYNFCTPVGNVSTSNAIIENNIKNLKCNKCGYMKLVDEKQGEYINVK